MLYKVAQSYAEDKKHKKSTKLHLLFVTLILPYLNFLYCEIASAAKVHPFTRTSVVAGLTGIIL
jgi:hypothetical protein